MSSQIQCFENKFANGVKDSNPILAPVPTPTLAPIANENYITLKPSSWKQGYDRVRIYFFLKGVEKETIEAEFEPQSCDVKIHDFKGKNYRCTIPKLHKEILPEKCTVLVRPTRVVISLFKASEEIWLDVVEHVCPPLPTPNLVPIVNGVKLPRNRALKYVMLKPFNWYQDKNTVKGVERENIEVEFKPMSFDVRFHEVKGKNYRCFVPELIDEIPPEKCNVVMWSIRIEITLVKASEGIWKDLQLSKEHVSTSFPTPTVNTAVNAVNMSSNRALNDSMLASPRKYENDGVGLSMVAAMKDSAVVKLDNLVLSSAKVVDNFIIEKCKPRFFTSKVRPQRNPEEEDAKEVPQHLLRYDRPVDAGDTSVARGYSQLALKKYNEENSTDFVLVKAVNLSMMLLDDGRMVFHMNFEAKKQNEDDREAALFFGEIKDLCRTIVCTILDGSTEIQTYCRGCHPEDMIKYPVDGFDRDCRMHYRQGWFQFLQPWILCQIEQPTVFVNETSC